jgi:hypothetical protein
LLGRRSPPFSTLKVPFAPTLIDTFTTIAFSSTAGEEFPVADDPPLEEEPLLADELSVIELAIKLSVLSVIALAVATSPGALITTMVGDALRVCGLKPNCGDAKLDCTWVAAVCATRARALGPGLGVGAGVAGLIVPVSPVGSVMP